MIKIKQRKNKKRVGEYTLYKFEDVKTSTDMFKLIDEEGKNVITTHNMTFMLNFIMRLKESGHTVKLDVSFCDKCNFDDDCAGCVLYTQHGCMLAPEKGVIGCQNLMN